MHKTLHSQPVNILVCLFDFKVFIFPMHASQGMPNKNPSFTNLLLVVSCPSPNTFLIMQNKKITVGILLEVCQNVKTQPTAKLLSVTLSHASFTFYTSAVIKVYIPNIFEYKNILNINTIQKNASWLHCINISYFTIRF